MAVSAAYVTFVKSRETSLAAEVGTLALVAIADQDLADLLRKGSPGDFLGGLDDLDGEPGAEPIKVARLDIAASSLQSREVLGVLVNSTLGASNLEEALTRWSIRAKPEGESGEFIQELLSATVLVEHSEAAALQAAGAVGAAAAAAEGAVAVALITAGQIGGVAILIVGPAGIVVVGAAAAYFTWRVLTHRRRG